MKVKTHNNRKKFSKYYSKFRDNGFVLVKNFLKKTDCEKAAKWLKSQDPKKFAKSWVDRAPSVPLAIYFGVHEDNTPVSKIAKDKSRLSMGLHATSDKKTLRKLKKSHVNIFS